jgi:two-component system NarL family sensor kinase
LGLLNAARAKNPKLSSDELQTLATIGAQIGVAVERARLAERAANAARAEERASLARDMHDTVAQDLAAITLQLESTQRKAGNVSDPRVATALELARAALRRVRASVEGLREDPLGGQSLVAALSSFGRRFTSETGVQVVLHFAQDLPSLSTSTESELYRIAAEALANVRRHAQARRVTIVLKYDHREVKMLVSDDGVGFSPQNAGTGYGIVGMRERARRIDARLDVRSQPGAGTTVDVRIPCAEASA